jgi:hypothetical protein
MCPACSSATRRAARSSTSAEPETLLDVIERSGHSLSASFDRQ